MWRRILLHGVCSIAVIGACGSGATEPSGTVEFSAVVEEFLDAPVAPGTIARVLVAHPEQADPADRSIVHVSRTTIIVRRSVSGALIPISLDDIEPGQRARFRIENRELRSYPRQVFATWIEL